MDVAEWSCGANSTVSNVIRGSAMVAEETRLRVERAIAAFSRQGLSAGELRIHLGPAICGACYEVSAEVATALTGLPATGHPHVDLRALIAEHARAAGVTRLTTSHWCTRCDNARFFSHRAGDAGRQLAVIAAPAEPHAG